MSDSPFTLDLCRVLVIVEYFPFVPEFVCTGEFLRFNLNGCVDLLDQHGIRLLSVSSRYISFSTNEEEARYSGDSGSMLCGT